MSKHKYAPAVNLEEEITAKDPQTGKLVKILRYVEAPEGADGPGVLLDLKTHRRVLPVGYSTDSTVRERGISLVYGSLAEKRQSALVVHSNELTVTDPM